MGRCTATTLLGEGSAVQQTSEIPPFPSQGQGVVRITAFPITKALAMRRLAALRVTGLGMMAELVKDDVLDEDASDPRLVKTWMQIDQLLLAAVAAETDV